jgi:hypothetical protein
MEKVKKISKYLVNFLNMINALLLVLSPIWGWHLDNITKTIVGITGVISMYLVGGKLFEVDETEVNDDVVD